MATNIRTYSLPNLLTHRGRAVVLEDHADFHRRIDDESVAIDENSVLVLKQVGPRGAPGMAEWAPRPTRRGSSSTCFRPTKAPLSHS
jgi:dihydroxyacid dehydratase/phosphogluconate dehydratase